MAKEKVKKPFYKKWWIWAIVVVVIFAFAQSGGDSETTASTSADSQPSAKAEVAAKEDAPEKQEPAKEEVAEEKSYKIGDKVVVGDMEYVINGKETAAAVGPAAFPTKASGKFVLIDVTLKNNGNEAVTVDSSFFKLQQGEKTFEADTTGSMYANQGDDGIDNSFFLQEVNPDSEITGKVAFDVSKKIADSKELQLQVQTGFWGTETGIVDLN
ncbi:DUF4352 domain-containing protein [Glutamicibacter sp. MCAF14]|uniref:DUF4352 domain-containing protein n=1 Tax=Glutamicibacter sp. MCAF14 TaxID=3233043 RepID=UPI003F92B8F7